MNRVLHGLMLPIVLLVAAAASAQTPDLDALQKKLDAAKAAQAAEKAKQSRNAEDRRATARHDAAKEAAEHATHPGRSFRDKLSDGSEGPQLLVVPGGRFEMGSPSYEGGRGTDEGPLHEVTLKVFALGRTEVTRGEFATFVRATGYKTDAEKDTSLDGKTPFAGCYVLSGDSASKKSGTSWRDPGFPQDDSHPATCLSWNDASAYAEWLRRETGKRYRLPSEAELEFVIRAGSRAAWPWGADPNGGCAMANGADASEGGRLATLNAKYKIVPSTCDDGYVFTAPVGKFRPNAFGLYDTVGNVAEWTQDCGPASYANAPTNCSAYASNVCSWRVIRGGSWVSDHTYLRSADRSGGPPTDRGSTDGLRVAQDL